MQKCSHSLCCRENKPICVTPHDLPLNALKMTYLDPIGNFYCCAGLMDNFPFISALRDFNLSNNKFCELPKGESFCKLTLCLIRNSWNRVSLTVCLKDPQGTKAKNM